MENVHKRRDHGFEHCVRRFVTALVPAEFCSGWLSISLLQLHAAIVFVFCVKVSLSTFLGETNVTDYWIFWLLPAPSAVAPLCVAELNLESSICLLSAFNCPTGIHKFIWVLCSFFQSHSFFLIELNPPGAGLNCVWKKILLITAHHYFQSTCRRCNHRTQKWRKVIENFTVFIIVPELAHDEQHFSICPSSVGVKLLSQEAFA